MFSELDQYNYKGLYEAGGGGGGSKRVKWVSAENAMSNEKENRLAQGSHKPRTTLNPTTIQTTNVKKLLQKPP